MVALRRLKLGVWMAPAFLLILFVAFVLFPGSMMDKLHGVCFGI